MCQTSPLEEQQMVLESRHGRYDLILVHWITNYNMDI